MTDQRPTWPRRMLALAELWSGWSTCLRRQVGAVIYDPETWRVVSTGYNDTPTGAVDCGDGGCNPCDAGSVRNNTLCECVHAEMNAVLLSRQDLRGMHMAVWNVKDGKPVIGGSCTTCRKELMQTGIIQILEGDGDAVHGTRFQVVP